MKKFAFLSLLFLLALVACRENIDEVTVTEDPFNPPILEQWEQINVPVTGSVTGFVTDESGEPVSGAGVSLGNLSTTTDDYGHFFFTDINLNARGSFVKVEKAGYFTGSRRFFAVAGQQNRVKIELLPKSFDASFQAAAGGTVDVPGGASIEFAPASIQYNDGTPYNGTVRIAATWLDPSDPRTMDRMPGNLQGVDRLSGEVALATYGMIAVELESDNGEPLNILEGSTAKLTMPVPAEMLQGAPAEIPLWSFNEEYGMWVEESKATLQGDRYVGEVTHFSFWNCDFPGPLVTFTITLEDENGSPLSNYKVVITAPPTGNNWVPSGYGYSCPNGELSGLIPAGMELELEIYDICNQVIYSTTIGPFSDDVDLGTLTIANTGLNTTTISGELVDCDGDPVANGLVKATFSGQTIYEYVSGVPFEVSFSTCANTADVTVVGIDLDNALQSDPVVASPTGTSDLGDIEICDVQLQDYIKLTVDGVTAIYTEAFVYPDSVVSGGLGTAITYYDQQNGKSIYILVDGQTAGNYDDSHFVQIIQDELQGWLFGGNVVGPEQFDTFTITEYGNAGEPVKGNFSGTLTNIAVQPPQDVPVTGEFNIIRDF